MKLSTFIILLGLALVYQVVVSAPTMSLDSEPKKPVGGFQYGGFVASSKQGQAAPAPTSESPGIYHHVVDEAGYRHKAKRSVSDMMISNMTTQAVNITTPYAWTNVVSFIFADTNTNSSRACIWFWPVIYSLNTTKMTPPTLNTWHQCGSVAEYQETDQIFAFRFTSFTSNNDFSMVYLHLFMTSDNSGTEYFREYESAVLNIHMTCKATTSGCQAWSPFHVPVAVIE